MPQVTDQCFVRPPSQLAAMPLFDTHAHIDLARFGDAAAQREAALRAPVSYTHLTLPTSDLV